MTTDELILERLNLIEQKIDGQALLQKSVLNFNEACRYLEISPSHLYKLTSTHQVPHFCPQGKKLYFNREELNDWLQRNRQSTMDEIDRQATDYVISNRRKK